MYNTKLYTTGYDRLLKKSSLAQAIRRLRQNGLVELDQSKLIIKLTDAGRSQALRKKFLDANLPWDKKWRIVAFDIPETHRTTRNLFRRKLKELDFKQLQKSLWISKIDCVEILRNYIKSLGISSWVTVLEAENVDFNEP
jgi:phenylacetic acid degradation operon negative regulatory protein